MDYISVSYLKLLLLNILQNPTCRESYTEK